jgi:hypothetical protein
MIEIWFELPMELDPRKEINIDIFSEKRKRSLDYVSRSFDASSAGLSLFVGLDLRWNTA